MTLSRSSTPMNERREIHESVQELDQLIEDLSKAQTTDATSYKKRLDGQSHYYSSSSSLHVPGSSANKRSPSAQTPPLQRLVSAQEKDADYYASRLESELNRSTEFVPRGVFVKDVVEEEILVDHVLIQPKQQRSDKKFITRDQSSEVQRVTGNHLQSKGESYDNKNNDPHLSIVRYPGEKGGSMMSLNSAMTDQTEMTDSSSVLDPNKIINCYVCGGRVVGQVITALGRNYHKEHFTCAHCNEELGTRNFYEKDDKPYCEKDYQALFSPKCFACNEPILDKVTIALDQTFHPEHFVCAHCGCQFDADDGFHEKDGKPYCKDDFFELFANKCAGCNLPITANYITALTVQWHPDCFVCADCHCPFADGKFFDIDGAPYCEIHYHARRGSLCAVCRQPIIGKCITAMFRKFHPEHFTCTYCLKQLTKSFKEENDKPYCHDCFDKLYS